MGFFSGFGIGDIFSAGVGLFGSARANRQNQRNFDTNLAFQKESAQKAHQWEVADLRAAGLNPILSATGGNGAKPGGGSSLPDIKDEVSSALQAKMINSQIEKTKAEAEASRSSARLNYENAGIVAKQGNLWDYQAGQHESQTRLNEQQIQNLYETKALIQAQTDHERKKIIKTLLEAKNLHAREQILKTELGISEQNLRMLKTKYPGLLTEQKIDESWYGTAVRYLMRLNPFAPNTSINYSNSNITKGK